MKLGSGNTWNLKSKEKETECSARWVGSSGGPLMPWTLWSACPSSVFSSGLMMGLPQGDMSLFMTRTGSYPSLFPVTQVSARTIVDIC